MVHPHQSESVASKSHSGRGRQRSQKAQEAVLKATVELMSTHPLRDVTVEAIAREAKVAKTTIYRWWTAKSFIALDAFSRIIERKVVIPNTGSAYRDFTEQLKSALRFYKSSSGSTIRQFMAESQSDPEFQTAFNERFLQPRREAVKVIWERGIARGELSPAIDMDTVLDLIYGPMIFRLLTAHAPINDEKAGIIVAAAFHGIRNTPDSDVRDSEGGRTR